jgi:hypothetical protein
VAAGAIYGSGYHRATTRKDRQKVVAGGWEEMATGRKRVSVGVGPFVRSVLTTLNNQGKLGSAAR